MSGLQPVSAEELRAQANRALAIRCAVARDDPREFTELVLRDELTGARIRHSPAHVAWQDLVSRHRRVVIWAHVEGGKTQQLTVGRTLWEIGRNPNIRAAIVSNTQGQAKKPLGTIRQYIEGTARGSADLKRVFPHLRRGSPWQADQITVARSRTLKDPTVQALGVHGNVLGARLDLLVLDDILDYENTLTARERDKLWGWVHATLLGRLTPNARVVVVGNAHHPEDLMHRLVEAPDSVWTGQKFPVCDPVTGVPNWPGQWPRDRIAEKRRELGDLEFSRQMLCEPRDDSTARFKRAWVELCQKNGRRAKARFVRTLEDLPDAQWEQAITEPEGHAGPPGGRVYTGVDLGVSQRANADLTVLFTILVHADGLRQPLDIVSGRWTAPEILNRIADVHQRYDSTMIVETVAAQDFIRQFAERYKGIPVVPFRTRAQNKWHPQWGVESIATELEAGRWLIPDEGDHEDLRGWIQEMLYYDPAGHTGDRLMACWFAREGARRDEAKYHRQRRPVGVRLF